jgi:uncharacterized RmlC-like cupin family protein
VHRSYKEHRISKAIWEILSRCWFGDKRLGWDGKENMDDVFYIPPKSPVKEDNRCSTIINSSQIHLEVHGYMHFEIVKQLLKLDFAPFERSSKIEQSW